MTSSRGEQTVDACPGSLRLHEAVDGHLARIRIPGGRPPAGAWAGLADIADEFGDGRIDLTVRGNVELRALPGDPEPLAARLSQLGLLPSLSHDRVRVIAASPLAGLDRSESAVIDDLVPMLDAAICTVDELTDLSAKFLFGLDDGSGDVAGLLPDVLGMLQPDGRFAVVVGAVDTGVRVGPDELPQMMIACAQAFREVRAEMTGVWRVCELPCGPGPVIDAFLDRINDRPQEDSPLVGAMNPGVGPVGVYDQADGRYALAVLAPLGRYTSKQIRMLSQACGPRGMRTTPWRSLVIGDLSEPALQELLDAAPYTKLIVTQTSAWVGLTACSGTGACAKAHGDVRAIARQITANAGAGARAHLSGCDRRCGHPSDQVIELVAFPDGYRTGPADSAPLDHDQAVRYLVSVREAGLPVISGFA